MSILSVTDFIAGYGSAQVINGIDFELEKGRILALLGRNGVGKTTLMKCIMGLIKPTSGNIMLKGRDIAGQAPHVIAKAGIAYVPQGRGIFPKLTVRENLVVGTRAAGRGVNNIPAEVFDYFPILKERESQPGGTLSGGEQQQLAIARALCGQPEILLLDEPSEGIQPNIVQQIGDFILQVTAESGLSVLIVEQNIELALRLAGSCMIMDKGSLVFEGLPSELESEELLAKYLAV